MSSLSTEIKKLPPPSNLRSGWPWIEQRTELPATLPNGRPWPRISIVTPSYNQGDFLEETVRSVLLQGYPNLEYIVIDGGSTDQSVEIIEKYAPWLDYWVSERDSGQSEAINKGFAQATGEYVAWLNSDDLYLPNTLRQIAEAFCTNSTAGLIYGNVQIIDEQSIVQYTPEWHDYDFHKLITRERIMPQQAAFWRRDTMLEIGMLRTDLHYCMDMEYWLRIARRAPIVGVNQVLAQYRFSDANKTVANPLGFLKDNRQIYGEIYRDPTLPAEIKKFEALTRANISLYAAYLHSYNKDLWRAFGAWLKTVSIYPRIVLTLRYWSTVGWIVFGEKMRFIRSRVYALLGNR